MSRRPRYSFALLVALFQISACAGTGGDDDASVAPATAPSLTEDLRIGVSAGDSEYMFGSIGGIVEHPDGTIFIVDTQVPIIRRYDADGVFLHDLGGEGQGPGEYQTLQGIKVTPDGDIAVWDPRLRRVTVLRPDGTWVRDFLADSSLHTSARPTFQVDHEGNFYLLGTLQSGGMIVRPGQAPVDTGIERIMGFHKYSPEGELLDTFELPSDESDTPGFVLSTSEGFLRNFVTETVSRLSSYGHLVVGHNADYAFEFRDGDEVLMSVDHDWEPVPLTPAEHAQWTAWIEYTDRTMQERGMPPAGYAPIPATKPAFFDFWPGEDGTVWVRRYAEAHERERPPRAADDPRPQLTWWQYPTWDVFAGEGEFLGTIVLPHDVWPVYLHPQLIWTIQTNEDEEDIAVRYRLVGLQ